MKIFVNFIQVLLIAGMVYPVYAMWNNEQLSNFCDELKSNMTKQNLLDLADQKNIKLNLNLSNVEGMKWQATATTPASFSDYSCKITGIGDKVASAKMTTL
jgi:hypothetical protein